MCILKTTESNNFNSKYLQLRENSCKCFSYVSQFYFDAITETLVQYF